MEEGAEAGVQVSLGAALVKVQDVGGGREQVAGDEAQTLNAAAQTLQKGDATLSLRHRGLG